ncbi:MULTISPECIES: hypothetical protein [Bradyrhizobium]|uniref:hypothetical protein n=1 Tax=Bradyrhizobium TaxID=374 RepID=UPI0023067F50|nr:MULTISPECIES: hypothetical protein [unclassified Bradyrhizobium]MDA9447725.1 hypothetical protein [Bradyrhizobium sp. CCBAU 21360]MDA9458291.1 hypothetical protein [Bradyrhizobium sp. CCBAU 21359]MDA9514847.1 hypothetical protein [Bradyrhizobium sp. CCBAU 11430]
MVDSFQTVRGRSWIAVSIGSMAIGLLGAFATVVALDPFGRLRLSKSEDVGYNEERPAMVSRAIDPRFNSVIIGNSASMPLMPQSLSKLTGQHFVTLSISGSGAPASIATMKFFLAHHEDARIVVVGLLPETWCGANNSERRPFPFWLYSSLPHYLWGLAGATSFQMFKTVFANWQAKKADGYRPYIAVDGYHRFIGPFEQASYDDINFVRSVLDKGVRPDKSTNPSNSFPAVQELIDHIGKPSRAFFVLLWTPRYIGYTPAPGSAAETTDRECKLKLAHAATSLPNATVLDWSGAERPGNSVPANFFDPIHYRRAYAAQIEEDIARVIPTVVKGP